jgi:hypothetical protein
MEQVGDFIYKGDDQGRRTGSTNRILLIDKDQVDFKNIQICGKPQPVDNYEKKCVAVKDNDRKFVIAQVREFDGVNIPCNSRDFVFIDIIDTKFSLKPLPDCKGLMLNNISTAFDPIVQTGNLTPPAITDVVVGYNDFPKTLESNFPLTITYYKPEIDYRKYEYVVTNAITGVVKIYPSFIGDSLKLPDDDITVELRIKGISDKLTQKVRSYKNTLRKTINLTACNSYKFYDATYTTTGTYTYTKSNAAGCDSLITLNLTIIKGSKSTINKTACGTSFTLNNQTYSKSGTYQQTLKNAVGCDSVITLNLTLDAGTTTTTDKTTCEESYSFNGQTYTTSGTYKQTYKNKAGCDSILVLNLTFQRINTEVKVSQTNFTAQEVDATYNWYNCDAPNTTLPSSSGQTFTPSKVGKYAVSVSKYGCKKNSTCFNFSPITAVEDDNGYLLNTMITPNPNDGKMKVNFGKIENDLTIDIISSLGVAISRRFITSASDVEIDLTSEPSGFYFLVIQDALGSNKVYKIIKE